MSIIRILWVVMILVWTVSVNATTITINTTDLSINSPTDGLCNLKEAIDAANNNIASGQVVGECPAGESHPIMDVIEFDVAILPAYFATFETYTISDSLHLKGVSSELINFGSIVFNRVFKFLNLISDRKFIISDVTFENLNILSQFDEYGAAILGSHVAGAELTIERVKFLNNNSERGGGALALYGGNNNTTLIKDCYFYGNKVIPTLSTVAGGGALFIGGDQNVTIENSTFENNSVSNATGGHPWDDAAGGAILVRATGAIHTSSVTIKQSTFSNNSADGVGGAIALGGPGYATDSSEVSIKHSTIIGNHADTNNNQVGTESAGGGIYSISTNDLKLLNNIIAGNTDAAELSAPDVSSDRVDSLGYNLIGNNLNASIDFPAGQPNANNDFVGELPQIILPFVAPLDDNGGPTPTYRLLPGSLAIDQGKCNALNSDQRHHQNDQTGKRTIDQPGVTNLVSGCDIGAFELGAVSENQMPIATDDTYTVLEGSLLTVPKNPGGLLANDLDTDALVITSAGSFNSSAGSAVGSVELFADGSFGFQTTDPDANGVTTFTYVISDLLNHDEGAVQITVIPVNDEPFYAAGQNPITTAVNQPITIPAWATDISPGPGNEAGQSLNFLVTLVAGSPGFFSVIPSLNASSGDLSFELAMAATGSAEIKITLRDDGGAANGGDNQYSTTLLIHASDLIFANGFE